MELRFFKYKDENRFVAINSKGGWLMFDQWRNNCDLSIGIDPTFCENVIRDTEEIDRDMFFVLSANIEQKLNDTLDFFKQW